MNISNSNFFISLFNQEGSSGTLVFETPKIKIEFDVKHSVYDYGKMKLSFDSHTTKDSSTTKKCYYAFIPLRFGCQGIKINCFVRKD